MLYMYLVKSMVTHKLVEQLKWYIQINKYIYTYKHCLANLIGYIYGNISRCITLQGYLTGWDNTDENRWWKILWNQDPIVTITQHIISGHLNTYQIANTSLWHVKQHCNTFVREELQLNNHNNIIITWSCNNNNFWMMTFDLLG